LKSYGQKNIIFKYISDQLKKSFESDRVYKMFTKFEFEQVLLLNYVKR